MDETYLLYDDTAFYRDFEDILLLRVSCQLSSIAKKEDVCRGLESQRRATGRKTGRGDPDTVAKLIKLGFEVCIESNAGAEANLMDSGYEEPRCRAALCRCVGE